MLLSVDNIVIFRSTFLKFQNTLKVQGSTQRNIEEDIIGKECYIDESDKTLINISRWKLPSPFLASVNFKYRDSQFTKH